MCRSTDNHHGFNYYAADRDILKLKAFHLRLLLVSKTACSSRRLSLPESLTLVYLPRISGSVLQIDNAKVRSDTPAFVTLHRVVAASGGEVMYGSRERVKAGEGVRFEVYLNEEKILKGVFRKDLYVEEEWNMECKCALEKEILGVTAAEVVMEVQGHASAMVERIELVVKRKRKGRELFEELEEIPEETEVVDESESESEESCSCCCEDHQNCNDKEEEEEEEEESIHEGEEMEMEMEVEGVRWAVDVGIWVMCLGVGYLVTKASSKRLRTRRLL